MPRMIEVEIDSVRVSLTNQQRIVILKEKDMERYLPIWIGLYEAEAITIALQSIQVARPQTHDLLKTLIQTLNAKLIQVEITSLSDDVFYGNLVFESEGVQNQVDCRPSDALALAARTKVPIYISETVMAQAGIMPEEDITDLEDEGQKEAFNFDSNDGDLDVFENFLQSMDLDDGDVDEADDEENDDDDLTLFGDED
ncbi:MAG: bifunctional nuclease family protein [Anaerolineaceae bacterium]|nr:bifunctional nuclease family protein [Anaerolineaceae bacterium]